MYERKMLGKAKVHPCTSTEALYRPYGPQGEQRYSSTLSRPRHQKRVRGQRHTPAAIYPRERPGTQCTRDWVGPRAGLDRCGKSRLHRNSIPGQSSPQPVAIPTELLDPQDVRASLIFWIKRRKSWKAPICAIMFRVFTSEDYCLLGCDDVQFGGMFCRTILSSSTGYQDRGRNVRYFCTDLKVAHISKFCNADTQLIVAYQLLGLFHEILSATYYSSCTYLQQTAK